MSIRNLDYLMRPASVAVIGASDRHGSVGATVWANLAAGGFSGPLWPLNRRRATVGGQRAYAHVGQLPAVPALAVICTPAATVPGLIAELGAAGCRAAVVLSSGLDAIAADGRSLRTAMLDAARPHLLRILGPNCVGLLVPGIGLNASFAPAAALPGRLAFVAQSGALVTAVLDWAAERRIGFSCFVSLGDGSDVDFGDLLDYLAADAGTDAILLYAESVRQARKFMSAARSAARAKPTLVVKAGRGVAAARAAFSHTGALAGADLVYDAALRRAGMLRVGTTAALFDAVATLGHPRYARQLRGPRLAILTNGGGPGVMAVDALAAGGGVLAALAPSTIARLDACLPATWSRANPVDIIGDAPAARYAAALDVLLAAPEVDAVLLIHAPTAIVGSDAIAATLLAPIGRSERPVYCCWMGGASVAAARARFDGAGLAWFDTPEAAVGAHLQLSDYRRNQQLLMQVPSAPAGPDPQRQTAAALVEGLLAAGDPAATSLAVGAADTLALLALYGIAGVATRVATDAAGAAAAARAIGYPVALKLISPELSHKSEVGGVVLDLDSDAALAAAAAAMAARLRQMRPQAHLAGFAVQSMVRRGDAIELIAGIASDPVFGPVLLFGQGGVAVEAMADQSIGLPPLNRVLAADLISRTRVARLLAGFRQRPAADHDAIADVLIRLGQLAADLPAVLELDINPLLADAGGVLALDARMRLQRNGGGAGGAVGVSGLDRLAILPYPRQLERRVDSTLGPLCIRPIRPEDGPAHVAFFGALTPQDIHMRMFGAVAALTPAQLARFTQIDYAREMALIATRRRAVGAGAGGDETLGVVRVAVDPDNIAGEFAIVVRSDLKGHGLGGLLFDCLLDYCRGRGLREVFGTTLSDNLAMQALARSRGFTVGPDGEGEVGMRLVLAPAP